MSKVKKPDQALHDLGELFRSRNAVYGDTYKEFGRVMFGFFREPVTLSTETDWNRMMLFFHIADKLARYVRQFYKGGHGDSLDDVSVYAQLLQECDEELRQREAGKIHIRVTDGEGLSAPVLSGSDQVVIEPKTQNRGLTDLGLYRIRHVVTKREEVARYLLPYDKFIVNFELIDSGSVQVLSRCATLKDFGVGPREAPLEPLRPGKFYWVRFVKGGDRCAAKYLAMGVDEDEWTVGGERVHVHEVCGEVRTDEKGGLT